MNPLDLNRVNASAPYVIRAISDMQYGLTTRGGIPYIVGFMEDSMVDEYESYQFFITNESGQPSPNDVDLWNSLFALIEEFFHANQSVMVYWCDTSDGHEAFRARLFTRKFSVFPGHDNYILKTIETNTEGVPYFAALVFRKDHPNAQEISSKVDYVVEELKDK